MSLPALSSLVVFLAVVLLVMLAVRRIRKKRLLFHCGGDCASCAGTCRYKR